MTFPLFRAAIAAGVMIAAAPVAHAENALEHSTAPLLKAAAQKAKDYAGYRYAYTVEHWSSDGEREIALKLRFDPRLEEEARWTLLAPATLDKPEEKAIKRLQKGGMEDAPILYDGLEDVLPKAELVSETQDQAIFRALVDEEDTPKDALEVFITLDKPGAYISSIELRSIKPFKPAPVAKVNKLFQIQRFSAPEGNGPALIASSEAHMEGEAMFKSFNSDTRQTYSDIEMVEMPAEDESAE